MGLFYEFILLSLLIMAVELLPNNKCITGYMTDVQDWVDEYGQLTPSVENESSIDLSSTANPVRILQQKVSVFRSSQRKAVKYLSLARCQLSRIPPIFHAADSSGRFLYDMVEYVTFYGNDFLETSTAGEQYDVVLNATGARDSGLGTISEEPESIWSSGLEQTRFPRLKELDLRSCAIRVLSSNLFIGMPQLEALYLGENNVHYISTDAFKGLNNLVHLDMSRNVARNERGLLKHIDFEDMNIFEHLEKLSSLDLSYTKITHRNFPIMKKLNKNMQRLSLCDTDLKSLPNSVFNETSLRILDLSFNKGVLAQKSSLSALKSTLQFLYAIDIDLTSIDTFKDFSKLEVLQLSYNHISNVPKDVGQTLKSLQILDLSYNRATTWFEPKFSYLPNLKFLSLTHNNINILSEKMLEDFNNINYLSLSGNFIVCNCESRDFIELAAQNEKKLNNTPIKIINKFKADRVTGYHTAFEDYNKHILGRREVDIPDIEDYVQDKNSNVTSKFLLMDYSPETYVCLSVPRSKSVPFTDITECQTRKNINYDQVMRSGRNLLMILLIIPCIFLPLLLGFIFKRRFRYFYITMRNSALLSMMDKNESVDDGTIYHYDVFVSYCNEDRGWVLDHLLPHLETDCNVSACLHERDFQVGLSILENIVACMDRSRAIMLIISQKFLKSQWCQFEMHLAQHRLLETRREDLTLVLLEEIPRRLRPNTLHYLMLTKTYIVWPQEESERSLFWKRLIKSFTSQKMKHPTRDSVA